MIGSRLAAILAMLDLPRRHQIAIDMLLIALATTALAGPALAYKAIVLDQPQDDVAAQSIGTAR